MANSKYEYVRNFEQPDHLLPNTWLVVRVDGRSFHKLSSFYKFEKPNDRKALDLMNASAKAVMEALPDLVVAYGVSDEYSFVFHPSCDLFERRASKLLSTVVSTFTAFYTHLWPSYLPLFSPPYVPTFDARIVQYPSVRNLRDYMSWRQADCHINNLYNTTFWAMVDKGGMSAIDAEQELKGTLSADKNEILFSRFGINYNNEPEIYRKGSVVYRDYELTVPVTSPNQGQAGTGEEIENVKEDEEIPVTALSKTQQEKRRRMRGKARVVVEHVDIIKDDFWDRRPWIISGNPGKSIDQ